MLKKSRFIFCSIIVLISQAQVLAQAPELLWTRTHGLPSEYCECWEATGTSDGGLAIAGASDITTSHRCLYALRTGPQGDKIWEDSYGGHSSAQAICPAPDNEFMIAGYFEQNGNYQYMVRYDSAGNQLWSRVLNHWGEGAFRSIQPVNDNGYILAGYEFDQQDSDNILLVKTDQFGDTLWSKIYGGQANERAWSVRQTSDSGFVIAGWTESFGNGDSDIYVIKTDSHGDSVWTRTYGGPWDDEARDIMETPDGGFVLCGKRTVEDFSPDYYFMKLDSEGDSVWAHIYHGFNAVHRVAHSFIRTADGGYALIGYNDIGYIDIFKTDSEGDSLWSISFRNHPVIRNKARSIIQTEDGGFYLCGFYQDIWLARLGPEVTGIEENNVTLPSGITLYQNYPNPFNANTTISFELMEPGNIELSVYDLLGRKISVIADKYFNAGPHNITFDAGDMTSGIYFYNLKAGDVSKTKAMIILK